MEHLNSLRRAPQRPRRPPRPPPQRLLVGAGTPPEPACRAALGAELGRRDHPDPPFHGGGGSGRRGWALTLPLRLGLSAEVRSHGASCPRPPGAGSMGSPGRGLKVGPSGRGSEPASEAPALQSRGRPWGGGGGEGGGGRPGWGAKAPPSRLHPALLPTGDHCGGAPAHTHTLTSVNMDVHVHVHGAQELAGVNTRLHSCVHAGVFMHACARTLTPMCKPSHAHSAGSSG